MELFREYTGPHKLQPGAQKYTGPHKFQPDTQEYTGSNELRSDPREYTGTTPWLLVIGQNIFRTASSLGHGHHTRDRQPRINVSSCAPTQRFSRTTVGALLAGYTVCCGRQFGTRTTQRLEPGIYCILTRRKRLAAALVLRPSSVAARINKIARPNTRSKTKNTARPVS